MTNYKELNREELISMVAETKANLTDMLEALESKKTEGINMGDRIVILYGRGKEENKDRVECIVHGLSLNGLYLQRVDGDKFGGRVVKEFTNKELNIVAA